MGATNDGAREKTRRATRDDSTCKTSHKPDKLARKTDQEGFKNLKSSFRHSTTSLDKMQ
jgi:hypothetical protein